MKLTKKHIGGLFHIQGSDGSWVYQLVAVKRGWLLFYSFGGQYYKEKVGATDWAQFEPTNPWPKDRVEYGWTIARDK